MAQLFKRKKPKNKRSNLTSDIPDTNYETIDFQLPGNGASNRRNPHVRKNTNSTPGGILKTHTEVSYEEITEVADTDPTYQNVRTKIYCEPCLHGLEENEACGCCINCSEYLCIICYTTHKNHKSFREHELKTLDETPPKVCKPVTVTEDKCMLHDEPRIYECYCKSCDQLACTECVIRQHRSCQGVEFISDVIKIFQDSNECEEFTKDLEKMKADYAECDDKLTTNMVNTQVYKENAKVKVSLQAEKIEKQLKATERNIKAEIQTKFEKEQEELNELKKEHDEWKKQFEIINTQIEHCRKSGHNNLLFIYVKKAKEILDRLKENVEEMKENIEMKGYTIQVKDFTEDFNTLFQLTEEQDEYGFASDEATYSLNVSYHHL